MISGDPNCFGHPTKVTFTFSEKCLKNDRNAEYPPYASYWSASPYRDGSTYNIQAWLAHKMKNQRQKIKLERAVQRAEKKLQIEYDKQMELKRKAADQRFKMWLKSKGFANQSPVMLYRNPHPENSSTSTLGTAGDSKRPKTARVRSQDGTRGSSRPRSASTPGNRKQITSTLDIKPVKPKPTCKALVQDDFMKMRHLAGKRYKKLKDEKFGFQCEDQILRKLQDLDWEEKCIKSKMIYSQKEDLGKVKAKALKAGRKKLKFKGDVITVEVEEMESNEDVEITFEEVDDKCSDIGCIEKEGVDFHIESRETIDLGDKEDKEPCRPMTAEPPRIECEETPPCAPTRPKSSKPRSVDKESGTKKEVAKAASADSKKSVTNEKKQPKEDKSQTQDEKSASKEKESSKNAKSSAKEEASPKPPKEKESAKKDTTPAKEEASPTPPKEKESPKKDKTSAKDEISSTPPKEKESSKKDKTPTKEEASPTPPKEKESSKKDKTPPKEEPSPKKDEAPVKEKDTKSQDQAKLPKGSTEKAKDATPASKDATKSKKEPAPPSAEKVSQKVEQSKKNDTTGKKPIKEESSPKKAEKVVAEKTSSPKKTEKVVAEKTSSPKKAEKVVTEKTSSPKKAEKVVAEKTSSPKKAEKSPTEKVKSTKEAEKPPTETPKPPSEKAPKSKDSVNKKITPNGKVLEEKKSSKDDKPAKETPVAESTVASDSFFD